MKTIHTGVRRGRSGQGANSRRRGSIVVIVALSATALLGMCAVAVDYGMLNNDANRVQRACDTAALAAAAQLKKGATDAISTASARNEAILVAAQNGVTVPASGVTFLDNNTRVRVQASFNRRFVFAPALLVNSGTVVRAATAEVTPLRSSRDTVPLVMTTSDFNTYRDGTPFSVQMERMQTGDGLDSAVSNAIKGKTMGEVIAIDTDPTNNGKSPEHWENEVKLGSNNPVKLGIDYSADTAINAALGNQANRLADAMKNSSDSRMRRAANAGYPMDSADTAYPNYPAAAGPRIFTILVADPTPSVSGNNFITIKQFATVYLMDVVEAGGTQLRLRILPTLAVGADDPNIDIGYPDGTTSGNFPSGPSIIRLVDDL